MSDTRPLATIDEVSAHLRVSIRTLHDQRQRQVGVGALAMKIGKHLRWRWEDLDAYLDALAASPSGGNAA
ncbi:MAG: helix-turn-helix domain-containing protein [Umezawaea sp.]